MPVTHIQNLAAMWIPCTTFEIFADDYRQRVLGFRMIMPERRFKYIFGISSFVCSIVWDAICDFIPDTAKPKHMLCALMFLKLYTTESVLSIITSMDEKTCRKWNWIFVRLISEMDFGSSEILLTLLC